MELYMAIITKNINFIFFMIYPLNVSQVNLK
jgi:hypothetical protein